ncbi:MAG: tetratricopeptide repeat protein [Pyrinomonadaceae bacterium]
MGENQTYFFEFGEYRLDPAERRLMHGGIVVPLTPKAFDTLCILVEHCGHIVEKNRLMELLWADTFVEEGNIADNVSRIRQALGDSRKESKFIETVSGRGYRFVAVVRRIDSAESSEWKLASGSPFSAQGLDLEIPSLDTIRNDPSRLRRSFFLSQDLGGGLNGLGAGGSDFQTPTQTLSIQPLSILTEGRSEPSSRDRRWFIAIAAVMFVVLGASGIYFLRENARSVAGPIKSIAILPFKPLVANDRDEALELGMSDSLISELSRLREVAVRPISAVRRYTDLEQDALAAGRELGVESILDGSIQRTGERIRVTARLVRVNDGQTLWVETFDEKFTDIFAVQDSISQKIIKVLSVQLSNDERHRFTKKYTASTEAYQLYLKGRYFWNKVTPDGFQKSINFYTQAIDIDPTYALAYAGLADSYNLLGSYGVLPLKESHPKARAAAEKALEIDSELAEAHASLAAVIADYYWDWPAAEKHFKKAIELNPNYPVARYWYSQHLARMGRLDEALAEARQAQALDPLSAQAIAHVGLALFRARRYDDAVAKLQEAVEIEPESLDAHIFLGLIYVQQGKTGDAIAEFQTVVKVSERNPSLLALLGYAYAKAGNRGNAVAILDELTGKPGNQRIYPFEIALINIGLDDREKAFEWLEKSFDEKAWQLGFLNVEPIFDPLREDPRFSDLLRRLKLTPV